MTKAIVFDLGGVILPLNKERSLQSFAKLLPGLSGPSPEDQDFFDQFERGHLGIQAFLGQLSERLNSPEPEVLSAWQSILEPIPAQHLEWLEALSQRYPLFLLSNTNELHISWVYEHLERDHGLKAFGNLFQEVFLSYEMGMRKPSADIYLKAQELSGFSAAELLFIDDLQDNVQAARLAGWQARLHPSNEPLLKSIEVWL